MMSEMLKERIAAGRIVRLHTKPTLQHYNVALHTFNMLLIADYVYDGNPSANLMQAILYHDIHEIYTGDIPYPVKRAQKLKGPIAEYEKSINQFMGTTPPELSEIEQDMLSIIDMLELMQFILHEQQLGNTTLGDVFDNAATICINIVGNDKSNKLVREIIDGFYSHNKE